jgi:3-(3-hydroxy-phenyl)propionate hydroxylase
LQAFESEMIKSVMNRYVDKGLVVGADRSGVTGRYLVQPEVTSGGRSALLDECLGPGFSIVGYDCDPRQCVDAETIAAWQGVGATVVRISSAGGEPHDAPITDVGNAMGEWLGEGRPMILLIRPDRFCMAAAVPGEAQAKLVGAMEALAGRVSEPVI